MNSKEEFFMDNLRRAILLFSAVVLVAVAILGFVLALDYYNASESDVMDVECDGEKYSGEDAGNTEDESISFVDNVLLIVGDEAQKSAEIISIMNFNSEENKINMFFVPCDTKYTLEEQGIVQGGILKNYYKIAGGEKFTNLISAMFDISVEKYAYMDFDDYSSLVKRFSSRNDGGVLFDMPVSIESDRLGVNISSGRTYFDGNLAMQLAKFTETDDGVYGGELLEYYDGSEMCRVKMVSAFIKCLVEQKFINPAESYYVENFSDLVNSVKKEIDTNVSDTDTEIMGKCLVSFEKGAAEFYIGELTAENGLSVYGVTGVSDTELLTSAERDLLIKEGFKFKR
jgi:anionic cell wall polymer biosynthesis LytR-Cps2A-Psr (LCP) family protein